MGKGNSVGARRYAGLIASMAIALALVGCGGLGLLPYQAEIKNSNFKSYDAVQAAYEAVTPGLTRESDLGKLGFDAAGSPNVEVLSYLGVLERFMPRDSIKFDQLDASVRSCIEARDACSAYVFRPARLHQEREGNWLLSLVGYERAAVNYGWSAEVVLLIQDGRVAYKVMSGRPHVHDDLVHSPGGLQDLGGATTHEARAASL